MPAKSPKLNYRSLEDRLKTFKLPPQWEGPVDYQSMAEAGFVYTGQEDLVYCFSCNVKLDEWSKDTEPLLRHKEESPTCSFCQGKSKPRSLTDSLSCYNKHLESSGIISQSTSKYYQPKLSAEVNLQHPDYSEQAVRLQSFKHWGGVLPAQELAEGGFYMIARRDVVRCFSCNVVVQDWESSDDVVDEHRRHSPNCLFLNQLLNNPMKSASLSFSSSSKGHNVLGDERIILEQTLPDDDISVDPTSIPLDQYDPQLLPTFPTMESNEIKSAVYPPLHGPSLEYWLVGDSYLPLTGGHTPSLDDPPQVMDDDTASCFIAGRDQNVEPLLHSLTEPSLFLNPSSIISSTSNLPSLGGYSSYSQPSPLQEDDVLQVPTISYPSTAANSNSSGSNTVPLGSGDNNGCHGSMHQNFSVGSEEMSIVEFDPQYTQLCQICYDEQVNILLLPCHHAKVCERCARHIIKMPCPCCQTPVDDIQRIFL